MTSPFLRRCLPRLWSSCCLITGGARLLRVAWVCVLVLLTQGVLQAQERVLPVPPGHLPRGLLKRFPLAKKTLQGVQKLKKMLAPFQSLSLPSPVRPLTGQQEQQEQQEQEQQQDGVEAGGGRPMSDAQEFREAYPEAYPEAYLMTPATKKRWCQATLSPLLLPQTERYGPVVIALWKQKRQGKQTAGDVEAQIYRACCQVITEKHSLRDLGRLEGDEQTVLQVRSANRQTLLHYAISQTQPFADDPEMRELVRYLLANGLNPEDKNARGESALVLAASLGTSQIVALLLQAGMNLESHDKQGNTALMLAVLRGHWLVVQQLLQAGANVSAVNVEGHTVVELAASRPNDRLQECLKE